MTVGPAGRWPPKRCALYATRGPRMEYSCTARGGTFVVVISAPSSIGTSPNVAPIAIGRLRMSSKLLSCKYVL